MAYITVYSNSGKKIYTIETVNAKVAVFEGYKYQRDFHVTLDPKETSRLVWVGRRSDRDKRGWPWIVRTELRKRLGY